MQIVAYADETGTHGLTEGGKEPALGVCGFIASPECWSKFSVEWAEVLRRYKVPYFHFRELHPQERKDPEKPYYGWSDEHVDEFILDLAIVAGREAVPFGGHTSQKMLKEKNDSSDPNKKAFECFFDDFIGALDSHWPGLNEKVDFFFEGNENEKWRRTLNKVIELYQKKDSRIGVYAFANWDNQKHGFPLQAADMFAYANRQSAERMWETKERPSYRILDLILLRNLFPQTVKTHFSQLSPENWEILIQAFRDDKKSRDSANKALGLKPEKYYPLIHHPLFKNGKFTY